MFEKLDSKEKSLKLDELRRRRDVHKNMKVLQTGDELVIWRRPSPEMIVNRLFTM